MDNADVDVDVDDNDDDDEEFSWYVLRDPYTVEARIDGFVKYTEKKFRKRYRMSKTTAQYVLAKIENKIKSPSNRNHAVSPAAKLLLALRFYGGDLNLLDAGDLQGVSKTTACRIIGQVSHEIAMLADEFVKMPTSTHEIEAAREKFYTRGAMPRVIASLDCTHVRIFGPGIRNLNEVFRGRKGYFLLNVQTCSSEDLKILDIVARFPGSVHDETIWKNSPVKRRLEHGVYGADSIIVADGGYANTRFVVTPLRNPVTVLEKTFQESVIRTRNPVERQYGVWKRRFPVLSLGLRLSLKRTMSVIVACAVLHNICLAFEGQEPPPVNPDVPEVVLDDVDDYPTVTASSANDTVYDDGITARDQLLAEYFPALLQI